MISYRDQSETDAIASMASVTSLITTPKADLVLDVCRHGLLKRTISRFRLWAKPRAHRVGGSGSIS